MTQRQVSVQIPRGHCRSCCEVVVLVDPELPAVAGNGRLQVNGLCPACRSTVTSFFKATPIEKLPPQGLDPAIVGLLATGIRQGFKEASSLARKQRADNMLAVVLRTKDLVSSVRSSAFFLGGAQTVGAYRAEADREWSAYITPDQETGLSLQDVYQMDAIRRAQDAASQDDPTSFCPHALSSEDRLRLAAWRPLRDSPWRNARPPRSRSGASPPTWRSAGQPL